MPLATEQLRSWFTHHTRTNETAPKFDAIRKAESDVIMDVWTTLGRIGPDFNHLAREIDRSTLHLAEVIDATAPDCADKDAAIWCVRLAHDALIEWASQKAEPQERDPAAMLVHELFAQAHRELVRARLHANSAIVRRSR